MTLGQRQKREFATSSLLLGTPMDHVNEGTAKSRPPVDFSTFDSELLRHRILNSAQAAAYSGFSLPHWRRLCRAGRAPAPIRIGERKLGWRLSDLDASHEQAARKS